MAMGSCRTVDMKTETSPPAPKFTAMSAEAFAAITVGVEVTHRSGATYRCDFLRSDGAKSFRKVVDGKMVQSSKYLVAANVAAISAKPTRPRNGSPVSAWREYGAAIGAPSNFAAYKARQ